MTCGSQATAWTGLTLLLAATLTVAGGCGGGDEGNGATPKGGKTAVASKEKPGARKGGGEAATPAEARKPDPTADKAGKADAPTDSQAVGGSTPGASQPVNPTAAGKPTMNAEPGQPDNAAAAGKPTVNAEPARPAAKVESTRPPLADPRLILTLADVTAIAGPKARMKRAALAGMPRTEDSDSIMFVPEKGDSFGFALQFFRTRNAQETKKRYEALQASYPNSQEISPVSGKTFFSYWDEVMHIAFVNPAKNMVVVVSCGRSFCDSNKLMELSQTVSDRLK
ncbi:MAG TPA: hypothetical protein PLY68_02080 [Myxococcota bacterium]|nr:hypothetical protein [Myxococcota bacterium]HNZ02529.1 hypothetical protein [Myxococcota bacterium]HOD06503.1 hypothetical protein [Myxococcota bacterium]HQP94966.1 hypothetical protein [Myxococcota bacterium]